MRISNKRRMFIEEYLHDFNATQAAIRAGYSERSARSIGQRLLTIDDISEAINERIAERAMSADEVLIRLGEQARASVEDFISIYGEGANQWHINIPAAIAAGLGHLIKSITPTQHGYKVELVDKQKALELLGRHHSLFTDRIEHAGKMGANITVEWDEPNSE